MEKSAGPCQRITGPQPSGTTFCQPSFKAAAHGGNVRVIMLLCLSEDATIKCQWIFHYIILNIHRFEYLTVEFLRICVGTRCGKDIGHNLAFH